MAHRKKLLAGNWKMQKLRSDAKSFFSSMFELLGDAKATTNRVDLAFGVPATLFDTCLSAVGGTGVKILAQNCHWEAQGAFTGELSPAMLQDAGLSGAIIGHSERRQYNAEDDVAVGKKWNALALKGLLPVVCVGETKSQREKNETMAIVRQQFDTALSQVSEDARKQEFVIAYEPVWAIGTGLTATPEMAQEVHVLIRTLIEKSFGRDRALQIRILYGGSLNAGNAKELLSQKDIDGGLIGGASLKADEFAKIVAAALT